LSLLQYEIMNLGVLKWEFVDVCEGFYVVMKFWINIWKSLLLDEMMFDDVISCTSMLSMIIND
jgi:hypothetical protein